MVLMCAYVCYYYGNMANVTNMMTKQWRGNDRRGNDANSVT